MSVTAEHIGKKIKVRSHGNVRWRELVFRGFNAENGCYLCEAPDKPEWLVSWRFGEEVGK